MQFEDIRRIATLGTGTMGHGVALLCALAGYEVRLYGRSEASLDRGFNGIQAGLDLLLENELIRPEEIGESLRRIRGVTAIAAAADGADWVIESLAEDLALKKAIFEELDQVAPPRTILSSNTSGLSPTLLGAATERPDRVLVTHFWNPPHLLPLVEIVRGEKTSEEAVGLAKALVKKLGKKPVEVKKDIPGFVGNRLQFALLREALHIVEEGWARPEDVDAAVKYGFGRRLAVTGPLESADLGGLDVFHSIQSYLNRDLADSSEPSPLLERKVAAGDLGAKTGQGFYDWSTERFERLRKDRERILLSFLQEDRSKGS